jgi:hypothetical protein
MSVHLPIDADLWTLFWNSEPPADGHRSSGELTLLFDDLAAAAKVKSISIGEGFFLLYAVSNENEIVHQAIVLAADVLNTGKAMTSTARYLPIKAAGGKARVFVRYLGSECP